MPKVLSLHVKRKYFEQIKSGEKTQEFRLFNTYWFNRLENKVFDEIHILLGYPKKDDMERTLVFPWNGYKLRRISHEQFQNSPKRINYVHVYAINLSMGVV